MAPELFMPPPTDADSHDQGNGCINISKVSALATTVSHLGVVHAQVIQSEHLAGSCSSLGISVYTAIETGIAPDS
jgi:hypothetical protein